MFRAMAALTVAVRFRKGKAGLCGCSDLPCTDWKAFGRTGFPGFWLKEGFATELPLGGLDLHAVPAIPIDTIWQAVETTSDPAPSARTRNCGA
jgi:hypothetical protein